LTTICIAYSISIALISAILSSFLTCYLLKQQVEGAALRLKIQAKQKLKSLYELIKEK